jgi:gliding motility-associated lipoprotein GldJ
MTYGGNEEIVLKGPKGARKSQKQEKTESYRAKECICTTFIRYSLPEYRLLQKQNGSMLLQLMLDKENIIFTKVKRNILGQEAILVLEKTVKGDQLANFKQGNGDYGGIAGWSDDGADITNEVKKYPANDFGLYDMAGNVAEWVADVYRPIIDNEANDFNYFRGNKYSKNKIGSDGKVEIVTLETMKRDTLSNGKIIVRSFPGQIAQVPVDEQETYLRQNFNKSNNINYRDGDKQSSKYYNFGESESDDADKKLTKCIIHLNIM